MSSTFNNQPYHPKREPNDQNNSGIFYPPSPSPPSLKVNKDSHVIKKPPSSSSSAAKQPRHPVIIYTHTPKVIQTNSKDFMALVQKLTGMPDSDVNTTTDRGGKSNSNPSVSDPTVERKYNRNRCGGGGASLNNHNRSYSAATGNGKRKLFNNMMISEERESSSMDENIGDVGQGSSFLPYSAVGIPPPPHPTTLPPSSSMYEPAGLNFGTYMPPFSIFPENPAYNFLYGNQPLVNFDDPFYFAPNMRSSFSSSSSSEFDGFTDFHDF